MLWDATTTFTRAAGAFSGSGSTFVQGVAVDRFGGLLVAGRFHGMTELVLGTTYDLPGAGFVLRVGDIEP